MNKSGSTRRPEGSNPSSTFFRAFCLTNFFSRYLYFSSIYLKNITHNDSKQDRMHFGEAAMHIMGGDLQMHKLGYWHEYQVGLDRFFVQIIAPYYEINPFYKSINYWNNKNCSNYSLFEGYGLDINLNSVLN